MFEAGKIIKTDWQYALKQIKIKRDPNNCKPVLKVSQTRIVLTKEDKTF